MMPSADLLHLQRLIWSGSLPLEIRLAAADCRSFEDSEPYFIQLPRQSYIGLAIKRIYAFFHQELINDAEPHDAWLEYEGVPLKWHYPLGLLYDLYSGNEPYVNEDAGETRTPKHSTAQSAWRLTIHYSDFPSDQLIQLDVDDRVLLDAFINSVKEADFIRNGTARSVMSLSKDDSDSLWQAVKSHDMSMFNNVNAKLLSPPGVTIKHIPLKIYLPTSASGASEPIQEEGTDDTITRAGHFKVVQTLIPLLTASGQLQTVGTALNSVLPELFPSRRNPLLAQPVLHGAILPMSARLHDLAKTCAYLDGFVHIAIIMLG